MKTANYVLGVLILISIFISFKTTKHTENFIWSDMDGDNWTYQSVWHEVRKISFLTQ